MRRTDMAWIPSVSKGVDRQRVQVVDSAGATIVDVELPPEAGKLVIVTDPGPITATITTERGTEAASVSASYEVPSNPLPTLEPATGVTFIDGGPAPEPPTIQPVRKATWVTG